MSDGVFWTERFFSAIGARSLNLRVQILFRFAFLFILWLIGAIVHAFDGLLVAYVTSPSIYGGLYLPGLIILTGAFWTQSNLKRIIPSIHPILDIDEDGFRRFRDKIEGTIFSFIPCFIIALLIAYFLSGSPSLLTSFVTGELTLRLAWNLLSYLFFYLLFATGIWMLVAIWYLILNVSRQEFQTDLLDKASEEFRELMMLILYYALFYFLTVTIAVVLPLSNRSMSWVEVIVSPYLIYVFLGAASIVFPLYNIHEALVKIKAVKLAKLRGESEALLLSYSENASKAKIESNQLLSISVGLQAIQIKEKYVQDASDWPVNMDFVWKLVGLIIMPSIVRIFIELFKIYLPI